MKTTTQTKPKCKLLGENGNVFNLVGIATNTLEKAGQRKEADELRNKVFDCESYDAALRLIGQYVEIN